MGVHGGVDLIGQGGEHLRLVQHLLVGVGDLAVLQIIVQHLPHGGDGRRVADIITVGKTHRRLAHIVDEHLRRLFVFGIGRDAHTVHKEVHAFLGVDKRQVGVFVDHRQRIAGVVGRHGSLAALHLVENLVHNVGLHNIFLLLQRIHYGGHFLDRLRVQRQPQHLGGNGVGIAGVIEHQHIVGVLDIPQRRPACGRLLHHSGVVDQPRCTPSVGYAVHVGGVKVPVGVFLADVGKVRDIVVVQGGKHTLLRHFADHILRWENHVIGRAARLHLGVQAFVGVKGRVVDLDAGQFLKGGDDVHAVVAAVRNIQTPVVDIQGDAVVGKAAPIVVTRHRNILVHFDLVSRQGGRSGKHRRQTDSRQRRGKSAEFCQLSHISAPPRPRPAWPCGWLAGCAGKRGNPSRWK